MFVVKTFSVLAMVVLLSGCINTGRYTMKNDKAPLRKPTTLEMVDAQPKYEPIYPWSLKPYVVLGQRYQPLGSAEGYSSQGVASWYGRKFHGHLTANGEIYDMYAMTAAHKTLPIPSYVRVTNLDNKRSIIVRVNDRGPFHDNRVIDLSYSAAYALDMLNTGTANVHVQSIVVAQGQTWTGEQPPTAIAQTPPQQASSGQIQAQPAESPEGRTTSKGVYIESPPFSLAPANGAALSPENPVRQQQVEQLFVQVVAASDGSRITETANQLAALFDYPRQIPRENGVYKLRIGPLKDKQTAQALILSLKNNGYPNAYMLYSKPSIDHN